MIKVMLIEDDPTMVSLLTMLLKSGRIPGQDTIK